MPRLFGTAGIRGPYLKKVSPSLAYNIGLAVARHAGRGTISLGHDARTTSPLLARMVAAGIMAGGCDALFLGLTPTPVLAYSVPHTSSRAGVMVTASHNPPPDNGLKVFQSSGMEYTISMEEELERIVEEPPEKLHVEWNEVGRLIHAEEVGEEYIEELYSRFEPRRIAKRHVMVVDCANGASSNYTPRILRMLGARVFSFNCHLDGYFPGREPEPRPDVLQPLLGPASDLGASILLAHDGDADRLAVLEPGRGFVKQDRLIAFYAKLKLEDRPGDVIVSIDVGRAVEEVVERYGGRLIRAKLGKTHEKLLEHPNAIIAAEPWKLIDPSWGPWVDGIYQAALIASKMIEEGKNLGSLLSDIPDYPSIRESFRIPEEYKEDLANAIYEEMLSLFKGYERINTMDGLRLDFEDGSWILIRPSGTEPKIRLYAEAPTRRRLEEVASKARSIIQGVIDRLE